MSLARPSEVELQEISFVASLTHAQSDAHKKGRMPSAESKLTLQKCPKINTLANVTQKAR